MKKKKRIAAAILATVLCASLTGCGISGEMTLNKDYSGTFRTNVYTTDAELKELDMTPADFTEFDMKQDKDVTLSDGVNHVFYDSEKLSAQETDLLAKNSKRAYFSGNVTDDYGESVDQSGGSGNQLGDLNVMSVATFVVHYPYSVYKANGKIGTDKKTVTYDLKKYNGKDRFYAAFTKGAVDATDVKFTGVKNKGYYKKTKTVKVSSSGIIKRLTVNGKAQDTNRYKASKDKKYKVVAYLVNGSKKTITFTVDKTKPKTNVKAKTYKKSVKVTFSDKTSGVKKATLDGKTIKSGKKVSKKGTHTLKITDKAGNVRSVTFKVK